MTLKCNICQTTFVATLNSQDDETNINKSIVFTAETNGIGYSGLTELLTDIGIQPMTEIKYREVRNELKTLNVFVKEEGFE